MKTDRERIQSMINGRRELLEMCSRSARLSVAASDGTWKDDVAPTCAGAHARRAASYALEVQALERLLDGHDPIFEGDDL